ncbi:hypothetical protein PGT21_036782 [Puccinia graminis f. sp. tritici]|uniref:Uncharacterized protein n=1 Tax=Puccinia graminis f. sp. tritici TaxID=56615 RepID=A0A5B0QD03_PUCGR|nr:hypothetical protein PGT21_036782 [Puccinia graminis f. sp. tritici]
MVNRDDGSTADYVIAIGNTSRSSPFQSNPPWTGDATRVSRLSNRFHICALRVPTLVAPPGRSELPVCITRFHVSDLGEA